MPQFTLKISNNIDITQVRFHEFFDAVHNVLRDVPSLDVTTCHSGVIQESFSYIGLGDEKRTKWN